MYYLVPSDQSDLLFFMSNSNLMILAVQNIIIIERKEVHCVRVHLLKIPRKGEGKGWGGEEEGGQGDGRGELFVPPHLLWPVKKNR